MVAERWKRKLCVDFGLDRPWPREIGETEVLRARCVRRRQADEEGDESAEEDASLFVCVFLCLRGSNLFSLVFSDLDVV